LDLSRPRTVTLVSVAALALLALRPVPIVERGLDWLLVPARGLAELSAPLGWFQSQDALAADPARKRVRELERARHELLERVVLDSAQPSDPQLGGRLGQLSWMRAEVVERSAREPDRIRIRLEDDSLLRHGLPVVSGDSFVGTIDLRSAAGRLHPGGLVEVRLITERDARIGARVERDAADSIGSGATAPGISRLVVGGLAPRQSLRLDVHNPSYRTVHSGRVVVDEPDPNAGPTYLADGFFLGELKNEQFVSEDSPSGAPPREVLGVAPLLDYATGLYQVLVLAPGRTGLVSAQSKKTYVLDDGGWLPARLHLRGETSPWREGRKLALGRRHGVQAGAALASGTRLAGRVTRAGLWTADVALVGDLGFAIPVVALLRSVSGELPEPHVLGRLVGFGRRVGGVVRFRWSATLELSPDRGESVEATLWTGSGEAGVPRGLLLGEALLPTGPGPHWIDVQLPDGGAEPKGLAVRVAIPEEETL
jgi:hypothetical protein